MQADGRPSTIHLVGQGREDELEVATIVTPGHIAAVDANGKLIPHGTAGAKTESIVVQEDALQGKTISDAYAVGDKGMVKYYHPGDKAQLLLAAGNDVAVGANLESNGDGELRAAAALNDATLCVAEEAIDNDPGVGGAAVFIKVRFKK